MSMQPTHPAPPPVLVQIGNIQATQERVFTPAGSWPIAEVNVTSADQTGVTTRIPAWAIVLVVLFIWFFFLSLLFLLARETRVAGFVSVTVQWGGKAYAEQIPVQSDWQRHDVLNRVNYLQSVIGHARDLQDPRGL